jgi:hypothetical protein
MHITKPKEKEASHKLNELMRATVKSKIFNWLKTFIYKIFVNDYIMPPPNAVVNYFT